MNKHGQPVIALDGTSASGKSTLAEELVHAYGAIRIEYPLFFRLIALHMLQNGYPAEDHHVPTPEEIAKATEFAHSLTWDMVQQYKNDPDLRTSPVSHAASQLSDIPAINAQTDQTVRDLIDASRDKPVVAEGRTIGKYVYPDADVKLYVDADVSVRAIRRHQALKAKGDSKTVEQVENDLNIRDRRDWDREHQSTRYDANVHHRLDTTDHSVAETLDSTLEHIEERVPALTQRRHRIESGSGMSIAGDTVPHARASSWRDRRHGPVNLDKPETT